MNESVLVREAVKLLQHRQHRCRGLRRSLAMVPPSPLSPLPPPNLQLPNSQTPLLFVSVLLFFRSVAHGAEKIVFITCQHLAALSYATQDSIKLSYTGMKLQNRSGTPQQNNFIFPQKRWRVFGCEVRG